MALLFDTLHDPRSLLLAVVKLHLASLKRGVERFFAWLVRREQWYEAGGAGGDAFRNALYRPVAKGGLGMPDLTAMAPEQWLDGFLCAASIMARYLPNMIEDDPDAAPAGGGGAGGGGADGAVGAVLGGGGGGAGAGASADAVAAGVGAQQQPPAPPQQRIRAAYLVEAQGVVANQLFFRKDAG